MFETNYDVIVVGGGHAGGEAAAAAANMGCKTLLATMNLQNIAQMSCNPAMGGIAKGQIVREIDALGGYAGIVADRTAIQFRMLNRSKGPAMWSPRVQSDRMLFSAEWRRMLEQTQNLDFYQEMITGILTRGNRVIGIRTSTGIEIKGKTVILTNGTFLNGLIHIGEKSYGGGRAGERAAVGLTADLENLGFESGRMKTGTPPRVDGRSLDFAKMEIQSGDEKPGKFSYLKDSSEPLRSQRPCFITYTNVNVHDKLREGFDRSPMFNGRIKSVGPRYCPSIEDKIDRFATKDRHQIFAEPEGWHTVEYYVNGFSTSLPQDIQFEALRLVPGFEKVKFFRPGYAIEYDYFPPKQIQHSLETKLVEGLFFAGQINGTTGYEEAGCQGLMAGINAARKVQGKAPFVLKRSEAYIGVLIDDLITKGTKEPYRMFTSRAEYRTLLRQDNADIRLTQKGYDLGLAGEDRLQQMYKKLEDADQLVNFLVETSVAPEQVNPILADKASSPAKQKDKIDKILRRPHIELADLRKIEAVNTFIEEHDFSDEVLEQAEIEIKYSGYIEKEKRNADKLNRLENLHIPRGFNYDKLNGMSIEARQKLTEIQPVTVSQASRVSGVSPADISALLVYLGR